MTVESRELGGVKVNNNNTEYHNIGERFCFVFIVIKEYILETPTGLLLE